MLPSCSRCAAALLFRFAGSLALLLLLNSASPGADRPVAPDGTSLLLMNNGRVVVGRISENAGGFLVESRNGRVLVPFDRVRLHAADRRDAYRRLLASFPNPSPETHLSLARWCLTQQLYDETKVELRSVLKTDPNHGEARNMLRRLEAILDPPNSSRPQERNHNTQTKDGFKTPPASSLAGLPGSTARDFVTRVQPMFMNNCAVAGCHDSDSSSRLRLERVRIGRLSSRLLTERNLAASLRYVDPRDPDGSPLLRVPRGNHGRGGRPLYSGSEGTAQFDSLRQWVRQVAAATRPAGEEHARASANRRASSRRRNAPIASTAGKDATVPKAARRPGYATETNSPSRRLSTSGEAAIDEPLLDAILQEERPDAFDPAEFNRQTARDR